MLKVAIVGCGKIADGHVEEVQKMPRLATVVAVCDLELLMAEQIARRYGIPKYYDDLDAMLERERPDVVHITTPPGSHFHIAERALEAGCHVYVEKPLAPTLEECARIVERAEEAGRLLTVGYTYYFDPPALEARRIVEAGELGEVVHVESFYGYNLQGTYGAAIMSDPSHWVHGLPGKLLQNNLDHLLYKIADFVEDETPQMAAFGAVRRAQRYGDDRDQLIDELRLTVIGSRVTGYGTFSSHIHPVGHFARIFGTKDTLCVDYLARTVTREGSMQLPSAFGRLVPAFVHSADHAKEGLKNLRRFARSDFHFFAGLNRLITMFYEAILEAKSPPFSGHYILRIARWMHEINRQVPQGASTAREGT